MRGRKDRKHHESRDWWLMGGFYVFLTFLFQWLGESQNMYLAGIWDVLVQHMVGFYGLNINECKSFRGPTKTAF